MFDMVFTGKRLAEARRQKDMTQMELAERLGISFQAVSAWERGNAMPDIAKLPDIADILGVSVDYLLGGESKVANGVINGDLTEKVKAGEVSVDDIADVVPVMKPSELDDFAEKVADMAETADERDSDIKISVADMKQLFPYFSDETNEKLFGLAVKNGELDGLRGLLSYLSEEAVDRYAVELHEKYGISAIDGFLSYMSDEAIDKVAKAECEKNGVESIKPMLSYMSDETIDEVAKAECVKNGVESIKPMLSYMSDDAIDEVAIEEYSKNGVAGIESLFSYLSDSALEVIAEKDLAKNGLANIKVLAPFMGDGALDKLVMKLIR